MAKINPRDLLEKQFSKKMRGVDPIEVTLAIREAAETIDDLQDENTALKAQVEQLTRDMEQYQKLQETLNAALVTAQKSAEDTRAAAKQEADSVIREAHAKAKEILFAVRQTIRKTEEELALARHEKDKFLIDFEALLKAQLEWIQSRPKDSADSFAESLPEPPTTSDSNP